MIRTFSHLVLITCLLMAVSCKPTHYATQTKGQNISIDENLNIIDSNVVHTYLPYKAELEKDMNRVIAISDAQMVKNKPESALTNLLADLLLEEGNKAAENKKLQAKPVVSFFNYGGIRVGLPIGQITVGKIFELMPFENEMVMIEITGSQIQQFCNNVAKKGGDSVGGVRFVISGDKAKNIVIAGEILNPDKNYWLVTNDYAASGGDDMDVFKQRLQFISTGLKIRDIIISNFEERQKNGQIITSKMDGRISNE